MGKHILNRLSPRAVDSLSGKGYYSDGGGLYLQVSTFGTKSWVYRFQIGGRSREMGLGPYPDVGLKAVREKATQARRLVRDGIDPIAARDQQRMAARLETAKSATFADCAKAYIQSHSGAWKNPKHRAQWSATLETYAYPVFGDLPVAAVDTALVMKAIEPLWQDKTETASRVRGRIESVLDWAKVRGYRDGENPARWRGHLDKLLPKRAKVAKVKHHEALPYAEIGAFMRELRVLPGVAPKALEFVILTAVRVSEAVNARWEEVDLRQALWTVPAARMKAARAHRVPLSPAAMQVLEVMKERRQSDYIFPGWKVGKPLTGAACLTLLDDMQRGELTVHGFRSTFRDWAAEQTNFPREIAEAALAHVLTDKTEAAYQRGDLLERRAKLMEVWAQYCGKPQTAKVMSLSRRSSA